MTTMTVLFTRTEYEALPEGFPAQLIDGCLVREPTPGYDHQRVQARILQRLFELLGPDLALAAPADVLVDELNVFQPDIVALSSPPRGEEGYVGVPLIAFEILSPSTARRDRNFKTRRLLGLGVREVWLVDPRRKTIEIVDVDGARVVRGTDTARSRAIEGFTLVPNDLFSQPPAAGGHAART